MTNNRIIYHNNACTSARWCRALLIYIALALVVSVSTNTYAASEVPLTASSDVIGQRLIADEKASWQLAIKRDATSYKAFHAPDFFTVTGTGVVGRVPSETSAMDPDVRFDRCDLSGFDVHVVAEDAVLITYHVKAAGLDHGKAFQLDSYASSLWMKRDGKWLNVFYQSTPAPTQ